MSIIDLLIAPITEDNIVNNIRLEKKSPIPFASRRGTLRSLLSKVMD